MFKLIRYIMYKRAFKKKCLHTTPCQCCAYWMIRKDRCGLPDLLKKEYKIK